jgi:hypothetical protein
MAVLRWLRPQIVLTLCASIMLLSSAVARADEYATPGSQASLLVLEGSVTVFTAATALEHPGVTGEMLVQGDRVTTAADGGALLTFLDGSELEMDASSQIELTLLVQTDDGGVARLITQLSGVTINRVAHLSGESSYELQTPNATALVRGTVFLGRVARDETTDDVTDEDISLEEGWVDVSSDGQQERLLPGQRTKIHKHDDGQPEQRAIEIEDGTILTSKEAGKHQGELSQPGQRVPEEDSEGHWRRSGNSFGLGKPKVAHCHGWLKAEGLARAECHGLSALPQCREVESMGLFAPQIQPPNPGSNLAKIGIASQPRDVK